MQDLISYVYEYQNTKMKEKPFNEIDALVFSQLSYVDFSEVFKGYPMKKSISMQKIIKQLDMKKVEDSILNGPKNKRLLLALASSKRYSRLRIQYFVDYADEKSEVQFCAMTFKMWRTNCIVFRGTDETFVGWKEDFNMVLQDEIPSQKAGALYLDDIVKRLSGDIYIAGHSKAGNIAVYGLHHMDTKLQNKINKVYNFDGPGHPTRDVQVNLQDKIVKFTPPASIVGVLFDQEVSNRNIIKSKAVWLNQHDPYSWVIEHGEFIYLDNQKGTFVEVNRRILDWVETLTHEEKEQFIDGVYKLIQSCDLTTVDEFTRSWRMYSRELLKHFKDMDKDIRTHILATIRSMLKWLIINK